MTRLIIGTLVGSLTFLGALFVEGLVHPSPFRNCVIDFSESGTVQENEIALAVFRYQIQHLDADLEAPTYYLSYPNDNDPGDVILSALRDQGLSVRGVSQLRMGYRSYSCPACPDPASELILRVGSVRWMDSTTVIVGGSVRRWYGNVDRAYIYYMVRKSGEWVVSKQELL